MGPPQNKQVESEGIYEFPYKKPIQTTWLVSFRNAIYNPELGAVFGRTPTNWAALILFYTIFFSALIAMFAICMYGLLSTLSKDRPAYTLDSSLIGSNPGLGFRPLPPDVEHSGSLVWYEASNPENIKYWTDSLDDFLNVYNTTNGGNGVVCGFDQLPPEGKVCIVNTVDFGPCNSTNSYSYGKSSPCIFIKLNRIFDWIPEYYNNTAELPENMDDDLKHKIAKTPEKERNMVWVSCQGENVADRENIGPISYYPGRGFPGYFYPFRNTPGYVSPLVAVHLERPARGVLINVECRAWAKNIIYRRIKSDREGSVHFEILVD